MTFAHPTLLALAAALCLAAAGALIAVARRRSAVAVTYSDLAFLRAATACTPWGTRLLCSGVVFACALLGVALARPHFTLPMPAKDGRVVICIDTSGSMRSLDVAPTRAEAAKSAARAFISQIPEGTRIGIVTFASAAGVIAPLTTDRTQAEAALDLIPPPDGATAIGDALAAAGRLLGTRGHRVAVLITDGVNNRGSDPVQTATDLARAYDAIYTIGIGSNGSGQLIPGTVQPASLDEETLRTLAQIGHGTYARAEDAGQLRTALAELGRSTTMERRAIDASLAFAVSGGLLLLTVLLAAFAAGRFP